MPAGQLLGPRFPIARKRVHWMTQHAGVLVDVKAILCQSFVVGRGEWRILRHIQRLGRHYAERFRYESSDPAVAFSRRQNLRIFI